MNVFAILLSAFRRLKNSGYTSSSSSWSMSCSPLGFSTSSYEKNKDIPKDLKEVCLTSLYRLSFEELKEQLTYETMKDELVVISKLCHASGKDYDALKPEIDAIAYDLWEKNGRQEGKELDNWLEAEYLLLQKYYEAG